MRERAEILALVRSWERAGLVHWCPQATLVMAMAAATGDGPH